MFKMAQSLLVCIALLPSSLEASRLCRSTASIFLPKNVQTKKVISAALKQRQQIAKLSYGVTWLNYLESLEGIDLSLNPDGRRILQVSPDLRATLDWMNLKNTDFLKQIEKSHPSHSLVPIQQNLVASLQKKIGKALTTGSIGRAAYYSLGSAFTVAAELQLHIQGQSPSPLPIYGNTAREIVLRTATTEQYLDEHFGITAIPLPVQQVLKFKDFYHFEALGVVPLGLMTERQGISGKTMGPVEFFEHDADHYTARMNLGRLDRSLKAIFGPAPVDAALYVGFPDAIKLVERLGAFIGEMSRPRERRIAEAVVFYIVREQENYHGTLDFNRSMLRGIFGSLLRNGNSNGLSSELPKFLARLKQRDDIGQAFKQPPSEEEVKAVLGYLLNI